MGQHAGDRGMGTNDGSLFAVHTEPFDPKTFYRSLDEAYRLQVFRHEVDWETSATRRAGDAEVVLNLSCGVQATPHVMLLQVALFKELGVDFVATGGIQFCCGAPFTKSGDPVKGDRIARGNINRLATWNSKINVQSCGSCLVQFQNNVAQMRETTGDAPFDVIHITEFVLQRLKEMGEAIPWAGPRPKRTRRFLLHAEGAELHSTKVVQRNAIIETLGLIPGVEYAGLVEPPSVGSPCNADSRPEVGDAQGHTQLSDISTEEYRKVQAELLDQARAVGAEGILTHHHKCHREWSKFSSPALPVIHYQSLLLEALGVTIPDRFRRLWQMDAEQILVETRPYWESWGIDVARARELVTRYFVPEYASQVRYCSCDREGSCFAADVRRGAADDNVCKLAV